MNPPAPGRRVVIIGYGNTLRGDDGIGPWVARAITDCNWPNTLVLAVQQLTPELVEYLVPDHLVFFIDATLDDVAQGVEINRIGPIDSNLRTHQSGPHGLLALAKTLYAQAPVAWLVRVA